MAAQFLRIESFASNNVNRIINEAIRVEGFCSHIPVPKPVIWKYGSHEEIRIKIQSYMETKTKYKDRKGISRLRKRRSDHLCLTAGVISWPDSIDDLMMKNDLSWQKTLIDWTEASFVWLQRKFDENLVAVLIHQDESHPHLHFFVVGDANLLNPGLFAHYVNGIRLTDKTEKEIRYTAAIKLMLDDYHNNVGQKFGLERHGKYIPTGRIMDRALAGRIITLEAEYKRTNNIDGLRELRDIAKSGSTPILGRLRF